MGYRRTSLDDLNIKPKVDCRFTRSVVCPYCGLEHNWGFLIVSSHKDMFFHCEACGKKFKVKKTSANKYGPRDNKYVSRCMICDYKDIGKYKIAEVNYQLCEVKYCKQCGDIWYRQI